MSYRFETQQLLRGRRRKRVVRHQTGSLRKERRADGSEWWLLRYYANRPSDGKRVERYVTVGPVSQIGDSKEAARREVARLHLDQAINDTKPIGTPDVEEIAVSYLTHELQRLAPTTASTTRHNIEKYILPRWGREIAIDVLPLDIESWFRELNRGTGLAHPTISKIRQTMQLIYKHGQRIGRLPRTDDGNPVRFARSSCRTNYKAIVITPEQASAIIAELEEPERTLALLSAATGLRISESLGLQWGDIDFSGGLIYIWRTWIQSKIGRPKTQASAAPVPLHPVLADALSAWRAATPYNKDTDWVFASFRLGGRQPREGGVMAQDYLRPAAIRAGVLPEGYTGRFGWHNFRHSLASFLVSAGTDVKTVQELLRHSKVQTTLDLYSQAMPANRVAAQGQMLDAIFKRTA